MLKSLPWRCNAWCSSKICEGILCLWSFSPLDFFLLHLDQGTMLATVLWNSLGGVVGQTYRLNIKFKLYFRIWEDFVSLCVLMPCQQFLCAIHSGLLSYYIHFSQAFIHWISKMEELPTKGKCKASALLHYWSQDYLCCTRLFTELRFV